MLSTNSVSISSVLVVYYCFLISLLHADAGGNETDHLTLLAFKNHITRDPFEFMSSWNDSFHFCHWQGVTCSRLHPMRVTMLDLQSQQLAGSLPPHLGNLTFLQVLDLAQNDFNRRIPPQIGNLFRLKRLVLANNSFQGQLPGNISHCSSLIYLGLSSNNLIGHIPPELGSLQKLQHLFISNNSLTGSIPSSLGNLSSLRTLSASLNHLEGSIPRTIGQLRRLSFFGLAANNLSGAIPPSIYNLSSITVFSLQENQMDGTLPPDLGLVFPKLELLYVYGNKFTGPIPNSITNASSLVDFDMSINQFTGKVPSFAGMHNLVAVALYLNDLGSGKDEDLHFLSSLANCSSLLVFIIMSNNLGGFLPESFSNFSTNRLSMFSLGENQIHGTIPTQIGDLISLTALDLQENLLSGSIPSSLAKLQNLGELFLGSNQLTGKIPSSLGNLTSLTRLHLHQNSLEGKIPRSLGELQSLEFMALNSNNLNGTIPKELVSLSTLSAYLDLSENQLSGSLPSEVGKLTMLSSLSLYGNKLSGTIPSTLGSCTSLISLQMNDNLFQGPIPESLSSLRGIEHLDLSSNNLSGHIPKYLESFVFLTYLNLSYNNFEGEVFTQGVFSNATAISITGNNRLCGGSLKLKLPLCTVERSEKQRLSRTLIIVISILSGLIGVTFVASLLYFFYKKRKGNFVSREEYLRDDFLVRLSYDALLKATNGLSNLIGKGSFGSVYKGVLEDGVTIVAVKVFNLHFKGASKSFMAECQTLRSIKHRNLVKILTACSSIDFQGNDFKALVYEYMPNGSLEDWLHPVSKPDGQLKEKRDLSLHKRINIAIDVASALNYLHRDSQTPIVHCDLKPSNVLINSNMTAHLGDFGLARFIQETTQYSSSTDQNSTLGLKGSIGYVAPEYGIGSEVSIYGDVYSYGILMLEIFTGKRPTNDIFKDGLDLRKYTLSALPSGVAGIVDPMLLVSGENEELSVGDHPYGSQITRSDIEECLSSILGIGVACSTESPNERMELDSVIVELHRIKDTLLGAGKPIRPSTIALTSRDSVIQVQASTQI